MLEETKERLYVMASFDILETGEMAEVVHSLAKWKRLALHKYGFPMHTGLYTDMNAIRRDEECDNIHSIYVDQWDWEKIITAEDRNEEYLKATVRSIFGALKRTAEAVCKEYPQIENYLPEHIAFVTSQELLDRYPNLRWSVVALLKEKNIDYSPDVIANLSKEKSRRKLQQLGRRCRVGTTFCP